DLVLKHAAGLGQLTHSDEDFAEVGGLLCRVTAAQQTSNKLQELLHADRFCHVGFATTLANGALIARHRKRRDRRYRNRACLRRGLQYTGDLTSRNVRQSNV